MVSNQMCHSRAYENEDLAEDVDDQVLGTVQIVEGRVLPQSITGCEQYCAERMQSNQLETSVVADDGSQRL